MLLTLEKIDLSSPLNRNGKVLVMAELILPRPAIALRRALLEVSLRQGKRSLGKASFFEKALLKERVDGPFGLRVAVTEPTAPNRFGDLLSDILSTGIKNAGDIFARMAFTTPPARRIAMFPSDAVAEAIQDTSPKYVAEGSLDLSSDTLTDGSLNIPIHLNQTLRDSRTVSGPRSRRNRRPSSPSPSFRKGTLSGSLTLKVTL
ncbi:MAG: hypothetical protein JJT75_08640 [Opitutales bacterium]|nr:hypothetical protein [Opitutales bacterium]MCH8539823.1 hypothetical protein [Opitutales bacterium]